MVAPKADGRLKFPHDTIMWCYGHFASFLFSFCFEVVKGFLPRKWVSDTLAEQWGFQFEYVATPTQ
jgi:hypothetical protein